MEKDPTQVQDPHFAWLSILPAVLGGLGLIQQGQQAHQQNALQNQAMDQNAQALHWQNLINGIKFPAFQKLADMAMHYDPKQEAQSAVAAGKPVFDKALRESLNNFNAGSDYGGMNQGLSTEGQVRQAQAVRGPTAAFEQLVSSAYANPEAKRMQALQSTLGFPAGELTSGYFQGANQSANLAGGFQPNFTGGTLLLQQALQQLLQGQGKPNTPNNGELSFFG